MTNEILLIKLSQLNEKIKHFVLVLDEKKTSKSGMMVA